MEYNHIPVHGPVALSRSDVPVHSVLVREKPMVADNKSSQACEEKCDWCGATGHDEYGCDIDYNLSDGEFDADGDYYFEIEWDLIKRLRSARGEFDA